MSTDPEIEQLKAGVNCATLLERMGGGYALDQKESSRSHLKYRRGAGEIIIINHDGKGWWDPGSDAKGDVFSLVQHLDPSLNFGRGAWAAAADGRHGAKLPGRRTAAEGQKAGHAPGRALASTPGFEAGLADVDLSHGRAGIAQGGPGGRLARRCRP